MRRLVQFLAALLILTTICLVAGFIAIFILTDGSPIEVARDAARREILNRRADELTPISTTDTTEVRFTVEPGTGPLQIGTALVEAGLIRDAELFTMYTAVENIDTSLEAGTYFLTRTMPLGEIAQRLTDSSSTVITLRIIEGWRKEEIASAIDRNERIDFTGQDFLTVVNAYNDPIRLPDMLSEQEKQQFAVQILNEVQAPTDFKNYVGLPDGASLEGFLYPDTYELSPDVTPTELRDRLLKTFYLRVLSENLYIEAASQEMDLYEAVTLASISEREAVHATEHPQIMSVYRNRLAAGMRLDADPTIQYALGNTRGSWWAPITRDDYTNIVSPYNTYLNNNLPPTPISNPAIDAIRAAVFPAETDYIYFRATCDDTGYHEFAVTYEEHLQNGCTG